MTKDIKRDQEIMRKLKVSSMAYLMLRTNMGDVHLNLRFGEDHYFLSLDSVPMEKEKQDELMAILFPVKEVYPIKLESGMGEDKFRGFDMLPDPDKITPTTNVKPKGRPKGSKNK